MKLVARPRHPVTGRQLYIRARSPGELQAYIHRLETLRTELKLGMRTPDQVDRELRYLEHGPVTLERAARAYLARPLAANTKRRIRSLVDGKRAHMRSLLALSIEQLDGPRCVQWLEALDATPGLHGSTIRMAWRSLSAIVAYACRRGWVGAVPWGSYKPRFAGGGGRGPREAARSMRELAALLLAARALDEEHARVLPPYALGDSEPKIGCAALLGLRQGELGGLRWHEIDWGPPVRVLVCRQYDGAPLKGRAGPVWIEAVPELGDILDRYRIRLDAAKGFAPTGPVFPSKQSAYGRPRAYTRGEVLTRLNLRAAVERAGLPQIQAWSAHSLRDTFVTLEAAARGGDLRAVASRSRHASIASLARYLRALSRDPAPPAARFLSPGTAAGGDGLPRLDSHTFHHTEKETPRG